MTELPAAEYRVTEKDGAEYITVKVPPEHRAALDWELSLLKTGQVYCKFGRPRKPRTCGPNSQNSHAWGHCTQIAQALGMEVYEVEYIAKVRAIKRGYPVSTKLGMMVPKSQADIDTVECGYLIDEYHQLAAENGVILTETEPEIKAMPEGYYTKTLNSEPKVSVKVWDILTDDEKRESDPARFDNEKQLEIF